MKAKAAKDQNAGHKGVGGILPFVLVVVLFGLLSLLPLHLRWGASYWTLLPYAYFVLIAALLLMLPPVSRTIGHFLVQVVTALERLVRSRWLGSTALFAASAAVFYLFHVSTVVYGDSLMIIEDIRNGRVLETGLKFAIQPLTSLVSYGWYQLVTVAVAQPAHAGLASLNAIAGGLGMVALTRLVSHLTDERPDRLLFFLAALTSGGIVLFFGYPENYTLAFVGYLWTLVFLLRGLDNEVMWPAWLLAIVTTACHMLLGHILLLVLLVHLRHRMTGRLFHRPLRTLGWIAAVSYGLMTLAEVAGVREFFVPPWPTEDTHYWAVSPYHLLDLLNMVVLVAPVALACGLGLLFRRQLQSLESPADRILLLAAGLALLASFWIDPALGAARDWDLLSFFGIPATLLAIRLYRQSLPSVQRPEWIGAAVILVMFLIVPNVLEKRSVDRSISYLNLVLWHDPHYAQDYHDAYRCLSWGVILGKVLPGTELDLPYFRRRLEADPTSSAAASNVAEHFARDRHYDSAAYYYRIAVEYDPRDAGFAANLAFMLQRMGRHDSAIDMGLRAVRLNPQLPLAHTAVGIAMIERGQTASGIDHVRRAYQLDPTEYDHVLNLGIAYARTSRLDSAVFYFDRALERANPDHREMLLAELVRLYRDMGREDLGRPHRQQLQREFPNSQLLDNLGL